MTRPSKPSDSPNADLHRVRDILFGEREREIAEQIAGLEKRLEEQAAVTADLSVELQQQGASLRERLASAIADASAGDATSRDQLREELMSQIDGLRDQKLDRAALAGLLGGIADRLGETAKDAR